MKKSQKKQVGIKDIAIKANVSIGTVDRVLHNRGEVAEATRVQVLKIVDELGYTPNILAKSLASKRKYSIAILIPDFQNNNPYWEKPLIGINFAAQEIVNYNFDCVVHTFDFGDEKSFIEKAEVILNSNPSGLIFAPVFYNSSLKIVDSCEAKGIPYVFFDVPIENCNNLAYFGQNSIQSGYLAARLMSYALKPQSDIYILKLVNKLGSRYHLNLREKGFTSFYNSRENKPHIHSVEIDTTNIHELESELASIFDENEGEIGIFVVNSRVYKVASFIENKKSNNAILIGYDLIDSNLNYLNKGIIQFLICQKPEEQGYKSVLSLFNYLLYGKPVDKNNFSPIDVIMKENIDYYKNFKV